ncbi:hypothetical protein NQ315_012106 [Exocentrus adspersus]|uniref:DUF4817 domain-containing protein n=1 Tax=Exocentrus adspersus TaxID=1586481 RepID=A0AAV8VZU6_9CUCU|nr:hypothetical protein NQ315_012106 [Exocentrus adspersus]
MSRDEVHIRDRLLLLAECPNPHKPFNVKRKSVLTKQTSKTGPKLSVQDFVRMDPGYTPDIEHLVFPIRKRNPQQVAPINPVTPAKTRSRLAEMFALSRHLQQRSADRETKTRAIPIVNMHYPPEQLIQMVYAIGESDGNCFLAARIYAHKYPNRSHPDVRSLQNLKERFERTGSVSYEKKSRTPTVLNEENQLAISLAVVENPQRSVDSVLESVSSGAVGTRSPGDIVGRRWVSSVEEPVRQNSSTTRISPAAESEMAAARGPNVSVLHLRSTSEPWETSPTSAYSPSGGPSKSYFIKRNTGSTVPPLTKHQSLGNAGQSYSKWVNSPSFHSGGEVNSPEIFIGATNCNRELSPVRWCDREVDGVYLGKSGWVQVQQRSLDENKKNSYVGRTTSPLQPTRRPNIKLSNYHFNSEPGKYSTDRPAYLSLQPPEFEIKTSSPQAPESPPSVTPIISPPPAFQDKNKGVTKSRTFFGKTPFLPRSNAIEDSDGSPPPSPPPVRWKTAVQSISKSRKIKPPAASPIIEKPLRSFNRIPQTKSLEDTTAGRRTQFIQHHGGSSSSSSSSMGFRSLDSHFNRSEHIMPRLSENTDSSIDVYEDADDEDNNSSSLNVSIISSKLAQSEYNRTREKVSPSSRSNRLPQHRIQIRRSPAGSDTNKPPSPGSSSSSSNEFLSRSPPAPVQQQIRRSAPNRPYQTSKSPSQEDPSLTRVRRSRSLQLPEKKPPTFSRESSAQTRISPQHQEPHKSIIKIGSLGERPKRYTPQTMKMQSADSHVVDEDMLREAEVVTGFLYGNRSRAAAQALLMHRYNNNSLSKEEKSKDVNKPVNNGLTVYYVGNSKKDKQKVLIRGSTSPSLTTRKQSFEVKTEPKSVCKPDTCDFWPHCAHRDSLHRENQFVMRSSQSYPTHQRSLDSSKSETNRSTSSVMDRKSQDQYRRRLVQEIEKRKIQNGAAKDVRERRISPNKPTVKRDQSDSVIYEKKTSPVNPKNRASTFVNISGSSSGSDAWLTTSDRKSNVKGSGASTPLEDVFNGVKDEKPREIILTRPGSAPSEERSAEQLVSQQRSMSLPKSFLSAGSYQQQG